MLAYYVCSLLYRHHCIECPRGRVQDGRLAISRMKLHCTMTSAPSPLFPMIVSSASCRPNGRIGGISLLASLAFVSAHCRRRTRLLIRASPRAPILVKIASLTLLATSRRREGSSSSASSFCNLPVAGRKMSNVIESSRSFKKSGFVAARGASWEDAKLKAGVTSDSADEVHDRINSISCRRSKAKCKAASVSRI